MANSIQLLISLMHCEVGAGEGNRTLVSGHDFHLGRETVTNKRLKRQNPMQRGAEGKTLQ